jgi:hypothetical protein
VSITYIALVGGNERGLVHIRGYEVVVDKFFVCVYKAVDSLWISWVELVDMSVSGRV